MSGAAGAASPLHLRVALDALGGDHAPEATVDGALLAARDGVDVVLVGDRTVLAPLVERAGRRLPIVDAPEVVGMDEDPALALRTKPGASVRVAADLVARGDAGVLVSAGSTGATLAAALLRIGRVAGVRRPAVAVVLPGGTVLLDAGASTDVQPDALPGYAAMGVAYAHARGIDNPRVGLLNVGAEPGKGNALARAAFDALSPDRAFAGNVEPAAVLAGAVDVVVTDGFTGNVFLKALEAARGVPRAGPGAAILLGCARPVLVAHGDADAEALAAALRTARQVAGSRLVEELAERLAPPERTGEPAHG